MMKAPEQTTAPIYYQKYKAIILNDNNSEVLIKLLGFEKKKSVI